MIVATANVLRDLSPAQAEAALAGVLDHGPHLVGLQEWGPGRRPVLRHHPDYAWVSPRYGENALGVRRDRLEVVACRQVLLGGLGWADAGARSVPVLPPRTALRARLRDVRTGKPVSLVVYHLVPGVQRAGAYRDDRPRLVARHRLERRRLDAVVRAELDRGAATYAVGDGNFHGLTVAGLTSAWSGREDDPRGTLGPGWRRKIDDVFGPGPADDLVLLDSDSDHRAVVTWRSSD